MSILMIIYVVIAIVAGIYGIYVFSLAEIKRIQVEKSTGSEDESYKTYFEIIDKKFKL